MSTYAIGSSPNLILQLKPHSHFFNNTQKINQKHRHPFKTLTKRETCITTTLLDHLSFSKDNDLSLENFLFSAAISIISIDLNRLICLLWIYNKKMVVTCQTLDIIYDKEIGKICAKSLKIDRKRDFDYSKKP